MHKTIANTLLALLFSATFAFAQSGVAVKQSGNITPNTVPWWITSGVIGGGVTAVDSPISSFGATGPICSNSARQVSGAWNSLCFQASTNGSATISLQNYGTAAAQNLSFNINGLSYQFPSATIEVTPEQFGYGCSQPGCIPYSTGDAGPAINAALNSVPAFGCVKVVFGPHQYNIVTPVLASRDCRWLAGQGPGSSLNFTPATCGTAMITYYNAGITTSINNGRITDLQIISTSHGCAKIAINLVDVSGMEVSGLYFSVWSDTTASSVCLQTNGREVSSFHDLRAFCDIPINMLPNPNAALSSDHFHFSNLYLIPASNRAAITATNILFSNTTFDGYQAWVTGNYGFYYNAPLVVGRGYGLSFYNVRTEQGTDPTAYSFYINAPQGLTGLVIKNSFLDAGRQGIYLRGVLNSGIEEPYYSVVSPATGKFLDADTTDLNILVAAARFESGVTQSLGGLVPLSEVFTSSSPIPTSAQYVTSATYLLFTTTITNSGNIGSSSFNNVIVPAPASTAVALFASASTLVFGIPTTLTGTSGSVGGNDSSMTINASGSFTLTLPAASGNSGRVISLRSIAAQTVASASSNVVPLAGGAAGTALLSASAGKWATLQSDGTNWLIMAAN